MPPADDPGPKGPTLSAVLPCHEEAANIDAVVDALFIAASACDAIPLEILLVCTLAGRDGTLERARALAARDRRVRVVTQGRSPAGYGGAIRLGVAAARAPWVVLLDADGQLDPTELHRLWALRGPRTAVLGVRADRHDSSARRLASRVYARVARWALPDLPFATDPDCAFKLLPRAGIEAARLRSTSGAVNLELLAQLHARGYGWIERPVTHRARVAGTARFERTVGPLGAMPRPGAALEVLRDVAALGVRRFMPS